MDGLSAKGDISLGSSGFLGARTALTCCGMRLQPLGIYNRFPAVPRESPQDLAREWHDSYALSPTSTKITTTITSKIAAPHQSCGLLPGSGGRSRCSPAPSISPHCRQKRRPGPQTFHSAAHLSHRTIRP